MENSRLYIEQSEVCRTFSALQGIKDFINRTNEPVYILSAPLTEKKYTTNYKDGLIILSPHRKVHLPYAILIMYNCLLQYLLLHTAFPFRDVLS